MTDGAKKLIMAIVGFALLGALVAWIWSFTNDALAKAKRSGQGILDTTSVARFDGQIVSGTDVNSIIEQTRIDKETAPVYVQTKVAVGSGTVWGKYIAGVATKIDASEKVTGSSGTETTVPTKEAKYMDRNGVQSDWYIQPNARFFVTVKYNDRSGLISYLVIEEQ